MAWAGYRSESLLMLAATTILVAASTALVGPICSWGSSSPTWFTGRRVTTRHTWTLPVAALSGVSRSLARSLFWGRSLLRHHRLRAD